MNKRGMSTIVANLLVILLVIVAVGIVWVVINNVIKGGTEGINLNKVNVGLKLSNVEIGYEEVTITVERTSGNGNMSGISFVVSNGTYSEVFEVDSSLDSLQQGTYTLQGVNVTNIETIEAYPIILSNSGEEVVSSNKFEYEVPYDEVTISGLVSWWRFDGNASDSFGSNDGTINGDVSFVSGRFGQAASFDGDGDYINITQITFNLNSSSLCFWAQTNNESSITAYSEPVLGSVVSYAFDGIYFTSTNYLTGETDTNSDNFAWPNIPEINDLNFYCVAFDERNWEIYLNGEFFYSDSVADDSMRLDQIGKMGNPSWDYYLDGTVDEVMVFNRPLTAEEVEVLYNLNSYTINFV